MQRPAARPSRPVQVLRPPRGLLLLGPPGPKLGAKPPASECRDTSSISSCVHPTLPGPCVGQPCWGHRWLQDEGTRPGRGWDPGSRVPEALQRRHRPHPSSGAVRTGVHVSAPSGDDGGRESDEARKGVTMALNSEGSLDITQLTGGGHGHQETARGDCVNGELTFSIPSLPDTRLSRLRLHSLCCFPAAWGWAAG